ncbi:class I SAM-dependent methyltransferase [Limnohabitans sp.]|jgi:ubiquinone/menaquinone biosynthesis C-methylase UbiE|uniref:class I SAM-dependent methyltransferase n=1 Tax=Limnohabitans sp. TaxID=1907725 RepID=UPI00391ACB1F
MHVYDRFVLPWLIDLACGLPMVQARRRELLPQAHGRVLEIGLGTGRNLPFYDRQRITQLVGVDPAVHMHTLARRRSARAGLDVELVGLSAEKLPLPSDSFDTVVCTYTLCSIADPAAALSEVARVLKPGGQLLFCEHGLSPQPSVARWQARIEPLWKAMVGGCHLTRNVPRLLQQAGLSADCAQGYIPGPRLLAYHFWGHARKA